MAEHGRRSGEKAVRNAKNQTVTSSHTVSRDPSSATIRALPGTVRKATMTACRHAIDRIGSIHTAQYSVCDTGIHDVKRHAKPH